MVFEMCLFSMASHPKGTSYGDAEASPSGRTPRVLPPGDASRPRQGAARRAHGSSAEHAMRDLIASKNLLRGGRHKARQNGPKHYPGDPTGTAVPLVCLSSISFFKQRKIWPPEGVGIVERLVKT